MKLSVSGFETRVTAK